MKIRIVPYSERGLVVYFGNRISIEANERVKSLYFKLQKEAYSWLIEAIPAYHSITIEYDVFTVSFDTIKRELQSIIDTLVIGDAAKVKIHVPVCYDDCFGMDWDRMESKTNMDKAAIIDQHTKRAYTVFMIGFSPGFPYMGLLDDSIAVARLETPRNAVPKNSVGIADKQTGIYPQEGPGGWNIIGRCPIDVFSEKGAFFQLEHIVQFESISHDAFLKYQSNPSEWNWQR